VLSLIRVDPVIVKTSLSLFIGAIAGVSNEIGGRIELLVAVLFLGPDVPLNPRPIIL
jgi:hypothetical protein